jgi:predicted ATP-binding protein involved in virulence
MNIPFIKKIRFKNLKCYEDLTFELKAGVNILYGANGSGKTSILEGINIAAGSFFLKISSVEKRNVDAKSDVRLKFYNGMPLPEYQMPLEIEAEGSVMGKEISWLRICTTISGGLTMVDAKEITNITDEAVLSVQNGEKVILPLIAYFSTQRLFTQRRESEKKPLGRFVGYFNALNATNIRKYMQSWFKDAEFVEYQKRQSDINFTDEGLAAIKKIVLKYFPEWKRLYYYEPTADERLPNGLFIVLEDKNIIPESLLSDGYRNFLWLLIEIAWRCYMLNPFLGEKAFSETTGIVTMDEIDLHLHPKWQQRIIPILAEAFPKVQFVITTHSPIVMSSFKGNILLLENNTVTEQPNIYGMKPAQVLEMNMRIDDRLPQHQEKIKRYFELINLEQGKSDEARKIRSELAADLSPNDPLFTEADALINFLSY